MTPAEKALHARIEGLQEFLEDEPDALTHFMLATELLKADRGSEAADHFRGVLDLDPEYTAAYRGLGRQLLAQGDSTGAIEVFEQGLTVAEKTGDLQTAKEMEVFLRKARS
jgi:tetratricopeptide (TPR) repeat protein